MPSASLDCGAVLNRLDWQLGEISRRQHRFAWLRDPQTGEWLAVEAYYPGNRVVVVARDDRALLSLCGDLVPRNGLFLVTLSAPELATDSAALAKQLRARLEIQGWVPRSEVRRGDQPPAPAAPAGPAPVLAPAPVPLLRRPSSAPAPAAAPAPAPALSNRGPSAELTESAHRPGADLTDLDEFDVPPDVRVRPPQPARPTKPRASEAEGVGIGITLVLAVVFELAVGGGVIGLGAGDYVLGFGFMLDACARVLGMVVASQNEDLDAAWTSVIFGSLALWGLEDSEHSDLAPVARVTAIIAGCVVALGLFLAIV
jgi:hypothetical protein